MTPDEAKDAYRRGFEECRASALNWINGHSVVGDRSAEMIREIEKLEPNGTGGEERKANPESAKASGRLATRGYSPSRPTATSDYECGFTEAVGRMGTMLRSHGINCGGCRHADDLADEVESMKPEGTGGAGDTGTGAGNVANVAADDMAASRQATPSRPPAPSPDPAMVERCADKLYEAHYTHPVPVHHAPWFMLNDESKAHYRTLALAVLNAMKEEK
jgi:hypothetical protein